MNEAFISLKFILVILPEVVVDETDNVISRIF